MRMHGKFLGWLPGKSYGFIIPHDGSLNIFARKEDAKEPMKFKKWATVTFEVVVTERGRRALLIERAASHNEHGEPHEPLLVDDIEDLDTTRADREVLKEISIWKREAKAEDNQRYFLHVTEADQIAQGDKYFVIGRKGSGKTAICEHINNRHEHDVFSEKLSFKNFPFNELYSHKNQKFTSPNQFITIWKYLIYSTACRLMLKNESIDVAVRSELAKIYDDRTPLARRINKWVGREFGFSLFGLSFKVGKPEKKPDDQPRWTEYVDYLEDVLLREGGDATYFILFDELDEDYRDIIKADQYEQYTSLITSLFKAVQDVRNIFSSRPGMKLYPVIFLRDDIYESVQDGDKNKWGDFRIDLNWDSDKIKDLIAFRISRAIDKDCVKALPFAQAWAMVFGTKKIQVGGGKNKISTFDFITRSTLLRPRDFVVYLQNCAEAAKDNDGQISPAIVRSVDKAFSNYLRQELTDELFAILPDIANIFDAISQLRKWNFSIRELEVAYQQEVDRGFIKEKNVKFVLQVLYLFSVIGNTPSAARYVFRYQNREARLNFNERVVVHRGLFKSLQIL